MNDPQLTLVLAMIRELAADVAALHQLFARLEPDTQIDGLSVSQFVLREKRASLERQFLNLGDHHPDEAEQYRKILDALPKLEDC